MRLNNQLSSEFLTAPLRGHTAKRLGTSAPEELEFPGETKNGFFDNKVSQVCRTLFFLKELGRLRHVTSMCPELQCCNKWGQPPGIGLNSRQRLGMSTAFMQSHAQKVATKNTHVNKCSTRMRTRARTNCVSGLGGDEVMQNGMSRSCSCMWLISPADKRLAIITPGSEQTGQVIAAHITWTGRGSIDPQRDGRRPDGHCAGNECFARVTSGTGVSFCPSEWGVDTFGGCVSCVVKSTRQMRGTKQADRCTARKISCFWQLHANLRLWAKNCHRAWNLRIWISVAARC